MNHLDDIPLSAPDRRRFDEQLPWYVNGTLSEPDRAWMDAVLARSPEAARSLERERALDDAVAGMMKPSAQDAGLDRLMARVRADSAQARPQARPAAAAPSGWLAALLGWLSGPRLAMALAVLVVAQAGVIGWQARSKAETSEFRATSVTEVRTLRITFSQSASEAQIRAALLETGARIVGGPTQFGEYWVASGMVSLDEIKASLLKSGLVTSMQIDLVGPKGQ